MVERQYEMIRRPRDESGNAKNIARSEDGDVHGPSDHSTPNTVSEAVLSSDSEVNYLTYMANKKHISNSTPSTYPNIEYYLCSFVILSNSNHHNAANAYHYLLSFY